MDRISRTQVQALPLLSPGDQVEAYNKVGVVLQGIVETVAPELGIFWIRTPTGERRLIDVQDSSVYRLTYGSGLSEPPIRTN